MPLSFSSRYGYQWYKGRTVRIVSCGLAFSTGQCLSLTTIAQLIEQRLGLFQVGGIEAFREPVVDFAEHQASLVATVLFGEKSCQISCCAQLKRLSLLAMSNPNRLSKG